MTDDLNEKDIRQEFAHCLLSVKEAAGLITANIDDFDRDSEFYDALFIMTTNLGRAIELADMWTRRFKPA
jgi:hypothetical protein